MKRIVVWILCVGICVVFCSCNGAVIQKLPEYPNLKSISVGTVRVQGDNLDLTADWRFSQESEMLLTVSEPSELSGMQILCSSIENTISFSSIESNLPDTAVYPKIREAWIALCSTDVIPTKSDKGWNYDLTSSDGFSAYVSQDGSVIRLSLQKYMVDLVLKNG